MRDMDIRRPVSDILILIVILSLLASVVYSENHEFEITKSYWTDENGGRTTVTGGDTAYLTLEIRQSNPSNIHYNQGSVTVDLGKPPVAISGVTVELLQEDWYEIIGDSRYDVQTTIPVGNVFTVTFKVKIKEGIIPGNYSGKVRISYSLAYDGSRWYVVNQSEVDSFNISVTGRPSIDVALEGKVIGGKTRPINVIITNSGDAEIKDAEVSLTTQLPLKISPDKIRLGSLKAGRKAELEFNVTAPYNFQESSIPFTVSISYTDPAGNSVRKQMGLSLIETSPPSNYPVIQISLKSPQKVVPGTNSRATLIVSNKGGGSAMNVELELYSQLIQATPQSLPIIKSLDPNETLEIPIIVRASSQSGGLIATLQVTGSYMDNFGSIRQISGYFTIPVESQSEYRPLILAAIEPNLTVLPGIRNQLSLRVENLGPTPIYNVSLQAVAGQASIEMPFRYKNAIMAGEKADFPMYVSVPAPLKGGVVQLTINMEYNDLSGNMNEYQETFTLKVSESLDEPRIITRIMNASFIKTGVNEATLEIENVGEGVAKEVTVKVTPQAGLSILGNSTVYISRLDPGEIVRYPLKISSDMQGSYTISITAEYEDSWGETHIDTFYQGMRVSESPDTSIELSLPLSSVKAGSSSNVTVFLKAIDGFAKDVWVTASSRTISILGSPVRHINVINEGEKSCVSFTTYVPENLVGSPTDFEISLKYITMNGKIRSEIYHLSLLAVGEIKLELLDYTTYPETPHPGDEVGITVSIVNKGTDTARQVTSYLVDTDGLVPLGGNKTFIGDAGVDSIIPVSYSLKIPEQMNPGQRTVSIKLTYKDSFNKHYQYTISIPINITPAPVIKEKRGITTMETVFLATVLIAGVLIVAWKIRSRKG